MDIFYLSAIFPEIRICFIVTCISRRVQDTHLNMSLLSSQCLPCRPSGDIQQGDPTMGSLVFSLGSGMLVERPRSPTRAWNLPLPSRLTRTFWNEGVHVKDQILTFFSPHLNSEEMLIFVNQHQRMHRKVSYM